jgi:cation diffusion facilitator family transporter
MADEGRQAVVAAFLGNLALTVLKGIAAAMTGSAAMLAETLHSIADMGNEALLFLGMRLAKRPPDAVHPLGHGRDLYFWAFVVSGLLFSVGGCFAIWEAVRTFLNPETHVSYRLNYAVLAGAFVFESASLAIGLRSFVLEMGSKPLRNYLRDLRDPTVLVVVLEDTAALISILIATGGLMLAQWTGNTLWDGVASGLIGVLLIAVAAFLALDTYSLLIGETASPEDTALIRGVVAREETALALTGLRTLHIGPEALFIALRIRFREDLRTRDIEAAVARMKDAIVAALAGVTRPELVVIEPASEAADADPQPRG